MKFAKLLLGYGFRIQKSAFEAVITRQKLEKLKSEIPHYIDKVEDSVRLYQIRGKGQVISWAGKKNIAQMILYLYNCVSGLYKCKVSCIQYTGRT